MIVKIRPYAKFAIAAAGFVVVVGNAVLSSNDVGYIVTVALTAAGVYRVPNA